MQITLSVNGVAFHPWCEEDGIEQSVVMRQTRAIVTLDGTLYQNWVAKRAISVKCVEVRDSTLSTLIAALQTNPATVVYDDIERGNTTSIFYITDVATAAKKVDGGNTYYSGFGFTLEER